MSKIEISFTHNFPQESPFYNATEGVLEARGFEVRQFSPIDEIPDLGQSMYEAYQVIAKTRGLYIDRFRCERYPEEDARIFDRIALATEFARPIFTEEDIRHPLFAPWHAIPEQSARGLDTGTIIDDAEIVITDNTYQAIKDRLGGN